jgi:hypothetical protein
LMHQLDAAFFQVGEGRTGTLPHEARARFSRRAEG